MSNAYRHHHYVPEWYQKRFVDPTATQRALHVLSLTPQFVTDDAGRRHALPPQRRRPIQQCFAEEDLYSLRFGDAVSTAIERRFFGQVDDAGARAVAWWGDFVETPNGMPDVAALVDFMTAQKLRTPKGLDWLTAQSKNPTPNAVLRAMVELRTIYRTIWAESVWQLVDATGSDTKFIVTDHPVTVYNRALGPRNAKCRGANDPDIRLHGSHTIYPLDLERCLVMTNRSWALNPYQRATDLRPNPDYYRGGLFNLMDVQMGRSMSEAEVREVNFILKSRAYRTIAAGRPEWLYPERHVSKADWADFGHGFLLMPDPRELHEGAEAILEYSDGSTAAYDAYGRRPTDPEYEQAIGHSATRRGRLKKFQAEFEGLFGPELRSISLMSRISKTSVHRSGG